MAAVDTLYELSEAEIAKYATAGYVIVRGLIPSDEVARLKAHFQELHDNPPRDVYDPASAEEAGGDPLKMYPRVMHPHRFDELSKGYLLDARVWNVLRTLLGAEPIAAQSMYYFKPCGARGQALHQDNLYLRVAPGTCIAAWMAVDGCDQENGCIHVVPNTHTYDVQCPEQADREVSFTDHFVRPPDGRVAIPAVMQPGDVLFFNGNVIHGSGPNRSKDRWRQAFICHYLAETDTAVSEWYKPLLDAEGRPVERADAVGGGPCGIEN